MPKCERSGFVADRCKGRADLQIELESLLAVETQEVDALERAPFDFTGAEEPAPYASGTVVGAYRLAEVLGEGGNGIVYRAERADDEFDKLVAIKVLRRGLDSAEMVRRFRSERQILADLGHPNIARLLDGGATEDGRLYFVMELIDGTPIDTYCSENRLSIDQRLRLFTSVCLAVQHAHQHLVVHRDLKPANILTTQDGIPKLLDFGIAKILDAGQPTAATRDVRRLTPEYASPEQIRGHSISTATDVYQLGLILYELLTGEKARRIDPQASIGEIDQAISKQKIPKPSATAMRSRRAKDESPRLRGDLDAIVLKALRGDPERRYASPTALADDIARHLENQPVEARPDGLLYRAQKFIRRNWLAAGSIASITVLSLVFAAMMAVKENETAHERDLARQTRQLLLQTFQLTDPTESEGANITAREILERGTAAIRAESHLDVDLEIELLEMIGDAFTGLGLYAHTLPLRQEALELANANFGNTAVTTARARSKLGEVLALQSRYEEAEQAFLQAIEIYGPKGPEDDPRVGESRAGLGAVYYYQGRYQEAESELRAAIPSLRSATGAEKRALAQALGNLGAVFLVQARYEEAEPLFLEALDISKEAFGPAHPKTSTSLNNLGWLYARQEKSQQAEPYFRQTLELRRRHLPPDHPKLAIALNNLGSIVERQGDADEAGTLYREALDIWTSAHGREHRDVATGLNNLALFLARQGDLAEAETLHREALAIRERILGPDHPEVGHSLNNLAEVKTQQGHLGEAELLLRRSLALRQRKWGDAHPEVAKATNNLAKFLADHGDKTAAHGLFQQALDMWQRVEHPDHKEIAVTCRNWGILYLDEGKPHQAEPLLRRATAIAERALPSGHPWSAEARRLHAVSLDQIR